MRVKAFSLMELIVVIILLGTIFALVLNSFHSKKSALKSMDIESYVKKLVSQGNASFYIYGKDCDKDLIVTTDGDKKKIMRLPFDHKFKTLSLDANGLFNYVDFEDLYIAKEAYPVCLKLNLERGKFTDKIIIDKGNKYLLFKPIYQKIIKFDNLEKAKDAYLQNDMMPKSIDDYYHE